MHSPSVTVVESAVGNDDVGDIGVVVDCNGFLVMHVVEWMRVLVANLMDRIDAALLP